MRPFVAAAIGLLLASLLYAQTPAPPGISPARAAPTSPPPADRAWTTADAPALLSAPGDALVIREPSQARGIFIEPDGEFYFVMRVTEQLRGGDAAFNLVNAVEPSIRVPLYATTPPSFVNNEFASLVLKVPADATPGLYDLEVRSKAGAYRSRRCVKVVDRFKTKFRFVHLSNMNVGDPTAPDFDDMLPAEVNLLAPEFIVATGDFTEWSRALNVSAAWSRVLDYLARFDAPVFIACGLHDHEDSFGRLVANGPIGTIDYGNYHGILVLDHPGHPIDQDADQLRVIDADLRKNQNKTMNFIVSHSDELALLDTWRDRGDLADFLRRNKVRMFITGGSSDWDFAEFANKIAGLTDFHFIRTHQSSTCLRDRATGVSHFRVINVDGDKLSYIYPDDTAAEKLQYSIPAGRLRIFHDRPNDGTAPEITATIQNSLNQSFENVRIWLRVAKAAAKSTQPSIAGGRLVRALDVGRFWSCLVEADLPEKGAVRILASSSPGAIPAMPPVAISVEGPTDLAFVERRTPFGLVYYAAESPLTLNLKNTSNRPATAWPIVRLNGSQLRPDPKHNPRMPLNIEPNGTVRLPLNVTLRRVSEGPHTLQIYFLDDPLARLTTIPVNLRMASSSPQPITPAPPVASPAPPSHTIEEVKVSG